MACRTLWDLPLPGSEVIPLCSSIVHSAFSHMGLFMFLEFTKLSLIPGPLPLPFLEAWMFFPQILSSSHGCSFSSFRSKARRHQEASSDRQTSSCLPPRSQHSYSLAHYFALFSLYRLSPSEVTTLIYLFTYRMSTQQNVSPMKEGHLSTLLISVLPPSKIGSGRK